MTNAYDETLIYEQFENKRTDLYFRLFQFLYLTEDKSNSTEDQNYIRELASRLNLEPVMYNLAISEKRKVTKFFNRIVTQLAYKSSDSLLFDKLLINWYTAHRILATSMKNGCDPFFLTNDELDLLILSFGFPYSNLIRSRRLKVNFLYNLIDFYHRKGSPYVFGSMLKYFGLDDVVISEWWLKKNSSGQLYFNSQPIYPIEERTNSDYIKSVNFSDFTKDVHWMQTETSINTSYNITSIKLPSITPYININCTFDIMKLTTGLSIVQEIIQETYTYWIEYVLQYRREIQGVRNSPDSTASSGDWYIVGTSPSGEYSDKSNYYAKKTTGWGYTYPKKNDVVYNTETYTHYVFNGEAWINLGVKLPTSLLNSTKIGTLNKPVFTTKFKKSQSIFQILLAIGYLFNSTNDTTDQKFIKYGGIYVPLDHEISGIRNNKVDDPNIYQLIYEEWDKYNISPLTRADRDYNYNYILNNFQHDISRTNTNYALIAYLYPDVFLSAIDYEFKNSLDEYILVEGRIDTLNFLIGDLESYLVDTAKIIDVPFAFLLSGFSIFSSYKDIIDFFKPYRVRIHEFSSGILIKDYGISQPMVDGYSDIDVIKTIGESIGRNSHYDFTVTDSCQITVEHII